MARDDAPRTIELYARSLAAGDNQARLVDALSRLEALDDSGIIDDYELYVWGDGVCLDSSVVETDAGSFIRERVASFREWAHETDTELIGFADRTRQSAITGRVRENIVVPALAVCERSGEDIECVAPCAVDEEVVSVADRLSAIGAADPATTASDPPP